MKKIGSIICLIIIIASTAFIFAGCKVDPVKVEWLLSYYEIDGKKIGVGFNDYDHFNSVMPDSSTISFDEDGNFYFKSIDDTEYTGTYKSRNTLKHTKVFLTFADGSKVTGYCSSSHLDATTCEAEFRICEVLYHFREYNYTNTLDYYLSKVAQAVNAFAYSGKNDGNNYYQDFQNGTVEKVGNNYFVLTNDDTFPLEETNYRCYTFNSEELKQGEIQQGECIVRTNGEQWAIYYPETNK